MKKNKREEMTIEKIVHKFLSINDLQMELIV